MSVMKAINAALTKSLLNKLPAAVAEKFKKIDEDDFKEFLQEWLATELKSTKGRGGPKAEKGKGRTSGYLLFSAAHRDEVKDNNPEMKLGEISKELGGMWKELKDKEKEKWNAKAAAQNKENGIVSKKDSAPAKKAATGKKVAPAKKSAAGKKAAPAKKDTAEKQVVKLSRHKEAKKWVIDGTEFVVQSPKDKTVIGKLNDENEVVSLSAADKKKCAKNGWEVKGNAKSSKKKEPEPESSGEDSEDEGGSGSEEEGSEKAEAEVSGSDNDGSDSE